MQNQQKLFYTFCDVANWKFLNTIQLNVSNHKRQLFQLSDGEFPDKNVHRFF